MFFPEREKKQQTFGPIAKVIILIKEMICGQGPKNKKPA